MISTKFCRLRTKIIALFIILSCFCLSIDADNVRTRTRRTNSDVDITLPTPTNNNETLSYSNVSSSSIIDQGENQTTTTIRAEHRDLNECLFHGSTSWCSFTFYMWDELCPEYRAALRVLNETEDRWDNCLVNEIWGFAWFDLEPDAVAAARTLGFTEERWYNTGYYSCDWTCGDDNPLAPGNRVNCLSEYSQVQVLDDKKGGGVSTNLTDLSEGDKILVLNDEYQEVYSFGHKDVYAVANFLQLSTSGNHERPLELSGEHLVLRQQSPGGGGGGAVAVRADNIQVGDFLIGNAALGEIVTDISWVQRPGLYSPLTKDGIFLANGVLVSSYTAAQEQIHAESFMLGNFEAVSHHFMSHVAMTPFRSLCLAGFTTQICELRNDKGQLLFAAFAEKMNVWISVFLLWSILPLYCLEQIFGVFAILYWFPLILLSLQMLFYASARRRKST